MRVYPPYIIWYRWRTEVHNCAMICFGDIVWQNATYITVYYCYMVVPISELRKYFGKIKWGPSTHQSNPHPSHPHYLIHLNSCFLMFISLSSNNTPIHHTPSFQWKSWRNSKSRLSCKLFHHSILCLVHRGSHNWSYLMVNIVVSCRIYHHTKKITYTLR